jgi:hypothetical protein
VEAFSRIKYVECSHKVSGASTVSRGPAAADCSSGVCGGTVSSQESYAMVALSAVTCTAVTCSAGCHRAVAALQTPMPHRLSCCCLQQLARTPLSSLLP